MVALPWNRFASTASPTTGRPASTTRRSSARSSWKDELLATCGRSAQTEHDGVSCRSGRHALLGLRFALRPLRASRLRRVRAPSDRLVASALLAPLPLHGILRALEVEALHGAWLVLLAFACIGL